MFVLGLASLLPLAARALDQGQLTQRFERYLVTNRHQREADHRLLLAYEASLETRCADIRVDGDPRITLLTPVTFNERSVPEAGVWKETLTGTACGQPRIWNLYGRLENGTFFGAWMMPGKSAADFELQRQTVLRLRDMLTAYYSQHPQGEPGDNVCPMEVLDTTVDGPAPDGSHAWREIWRIRACDGHEYRVPITFTPAPKGATQIAVETVSFH